jgi:hypothetical protein
MFVEATVSAPLCTDPLLKITPTGHFTGYTWCGDGAINRLNAVGCAEPVRTPACKGTEDHRSCETWANCTERPYGFCMSDGWERTGTSCICVYPCLSDAECGPDQACMCPGVTPLLPKVATCVPAECKTNNDCESGECGATIYFSGCGWEFGLSCRGPDDTCRIDDDCNGGEDCVALQRGTDPIAFRCESATCLHDGR